MKRTLLLVLPILGLLGLSVAVAIGWHLMRHRNQKATAIQNAEAEKEVLDGGAGAAPRGNNVRVAKFQALDTDRDGKLSLAEFGSGRKAAEAAKWFERRDVDHDGFISREEFLPFSAGAKAQ